MKEEKINILYVEDNPDDVAIMEEMLAEPGNTVFSLIHADLLATGLEKLGKDGMDIILLDLSLPDSHGFATFRAVKKRAGNLPIIVMTGLDDEVMAVKAVREGAQDYLVKGHVDAKQLMHAIRYAIERKERDVAGHKRLKEKRRQDMARLEEKIAERTRKLAETMGQLRDLTRDFSEAEGQERRRIAEILHGDLQQLLAAGTMQAQRLLLRRNEPLEQQTRHLEFVMDTLKKAQHAARSLSHDLNPPVLHNGSMNDVLRWLADRAQEHYGLEVIFTPAAELTGDSGSLRAIVYRIVQELLYNVVKHAEVDKAWLTLEVKEGGLWVTMLDHGCGFDPTMVKKGGAAGTSPGFGLFSITERIKALGGTMEIDSKPGAGSRFTIFLPLPPA